jgi:hypothetical protein
MISSNHFEMDTQMVAITIAIFIIIALIIIVAFITIVPIKKNKVVNS